MILERFKVPVKDQVFVSEAALRRTVTQIFEKLGLTPEDAAEGADVLTMTDLRGVETHGVSNMLRAYVRDYKAGKLDPRPGWRIVRESPGTAVIDAERRLGIIVGPKAMRLAIDKARTVGVGVVTVYNSGHFGAIGHFAMQAAQQNMVGVCFTGAGLSVVPTFAAKPMLGTNPIAVAAPARREAPMLFDAATSAIAGNKIRLAIRLGSPLLPGWVTDKEGNPITEEKPVFDRDEYHQLPLGGTREQGSHKGYGFALMAEVLSTVLAGALPTMLVTGGSGDLGRAIAIALAEAGADIAVTWAGFREGAIETCRQVEKRGRRTAMVQLDQRDAAAIAPVVDTAAAELGRLDVLVNNAGWNIGVPFRDLDGLTADLWDHLNEGNLRGPFLLARAAARHLRARGAGRIVNVASVAGLRPAGSSIAYAVSQAGLIHLTPCLARALAPDVTANCVAPGLMEGTRMAKRLPAEVVESTRRLAVLQRATAVDDVAAQVVAFCRADSVTGQVLTIDGGGHFHCSPG